MERETCVGCGAETDGGSGPVHRYLESSSGCWSLYGRLLSREYSDPSYMPVHALTVDAYALQHPGREGARTISSAFVHLASLHAFFEGGVPAVQLAAVKKVVVAQKRDFEWLDPPGDRGSITVADLLNPRSAQEHCARVTEWARCAFDAWERHHGRVAMLYR